MFVLPSFRALRESDICYFNVLQCFGLNFPIENTHREWLAIFFFYQPSFWFRNEFYECLMLFKHFLFHFFLWPANRFPVHHSFRSTSIFEYFFFLLPFSFVIKKEKKIPLSMPSIAFHFHFITFKCVKTIAMDTYSPSPPVSKYYMIEGRYCYWHFDLDAFSILNTGWNCIQWANNLRAEQLISLGCNTIWKSGGWKSNRHCWNKYFLSFSRFVYIFGRMLLCTFTRIFRCNRCWLLLALWLLFVGFLFSDQARVYWICVTIEGFLVFSFQPASNVITNFYWQCRVCVCCVYALNECHYKGKRPARIYSIFTALIVRTLPMKFYTQITLRQPCQNWLSCMR